MDHQQLVNLEIRKKMRILGMKTRAKFCLMGVLAMLTLIPRNIQAQKSINPFILFTGLVLTSDSLKPIPYVAIKNGRRGLAGYTDLLGHFDIVALKGDTLWFTQAEKTASWHVIPDTLTANRYNIIKTMVQDTINIPVIFIRALPSKSFFDHEFVNTVPPDDAYEIARKNLELEAAKEELKLRPADAKASQQMIAQSRVQQLYYYKQAPPQNYLSPMAWMQFLDAWKRGDFKKKKKK
jgi:hypothetical protein